MPNQVVFLSASEGRIDLPLPGVWRGFIRKGKLDNRIYDMIAPLKPTTKLHASRFEII